MTFLLTGRKSETRADRDPDIGPHVLRVLRGIEAKMNVPASSSVDVEAAALTEEEIAALRCEGRIAAFKGMALRSCPYNTASRAQREAWMDGYNTLK